LVDIRALSASHADRANGQNGRSKRMSKLRSKRPSSDIIILQGFPARKLESLFYSFLFNKIMGKKIESLQLL